MLEALERSHDVLAVNLAGRVGGPGLAVTSVSVNALVDAVERDLDAAGFDTAHVVGNSLGGWIALELASRGRARSVVALAPAGGWEPGSRAERRLRTLFICNHELSTALLARIDALMRRRARLTGYHVPSANSVGYPGPDHPSPRYSQPLRNLLPNAEWIELPGLGHLPMSDDPELVARTIAEFVGRARTGCHRQPPHASQRAF